VFGKDDLHVIHHLVVQIGDRRGIETVFQPLIFIIVPTPQATFLVNDEHIGGGKVVPQFKGGLEALEKGLDLGFAPKGKMPLVHIGNLPQFLLEFQGFVLVSPKDQHDHLEVVEFPEPLIYLLVQVEGIALIGPNALAKNSQNSDFPVQADVPIQGGQLGNPFHQHGQSTEVVDPGSKEQIDHEGENEQEQKDEFLFHDRPCKNKKRRPINRLSLLLILS